jgi:HEAT repeat protein
MAVQGPDRRGGAQGGRRWRGVLVAVLVGLGGLAAVATAIGLLRTGEERAALRLLNSDQPEERQRGAWLAARPRMPRTHAELVRRLSRRQEVDLNVREACVYALGRSGSPQFFDVLAAVVQADEEGYVRQAAWIAAARVDRGRLPDLVATAPLRDEAWDQLGQAAAWLETGDLRGVDDLLHWAAAGEPEQRRVASLALYRGVAPLLEALGRWPIQSSVCEGEPWPPELVAEVRRRVAPLDLRAIVDEMRPYLARATELRRDVARITTVRDRLARFLRRS